MAKFYSKLNPELENFIKNQKVFFNATATKEGRINLSPKGMNTFKCLDETHVAYLDLTGSGNETAAHIHHDGRITIMFCSFDEQPLILRLYGQGQVILPNSDQWSNYYHHFTPTPGQRQIILIKIESIQTSCGFAIPIYELKQERQTLVDWATKAGESGLADYQRKNNLTSIDGLPTFLHPEGSTDQTFK